MSDEPKHGVFSTDELIPLTPRSLGNVLGELLGHALRAKPEDLPALIQNIDYIRSRAEDRLPGEAS